MPWQPPTQQSPLSKKRNLIADLQPVLRPSNDSRKLLRNLQSETTRTLVYFTHKTVYNLDHVSYSDRYCISAVVGYWSCIVSYRGKAIANCFLILDRMLLFSWLSCDTFCPLFVSAA